MRAGGMLLSAGATGFVRSRIRTDDHHSVARALTWITICLVVGLLVFAMAGDFVPAILAFWLIYIARSLIEPLYTAWVNQRLDARVRATVISMSGQVDAIGQIASGPLVGLVGSLFSVQAAIALCGVILSPVLALFGRAERMEIKPEMESIPPETD
jgi:DHA3 family tetracycline resistance protein-like MFS transporter